MFFLYWRASKKLATYIFGENQNEPKQVYNYKKFTEAKFINLWEHYQNGDVNNFFVASDINIDYYGLTKGHAYAVKNVSKDSKNVCYVELVNPWDDADCVRVSYQDMVKWKFDVTLFGYTSEQVDSFLKPVK